MNGKRTIALMYGGRSAEHEVSLRSARSVFDAMSKDKYEIVPVLIAKDGSWFVMPAEPSSFGADNRPDPRNRIVWSHDPDHHGFLFLGESSPVQPTRIDIALPILHGTYGEDGTLQGLFELSDIPYVGCGVLASAVGMDKVLMKAAFREAGLEVGPFFSFLRSQWQSLSDPIRRRAEQAQFPLFVKPANMGSSVGISKVSDMSEFDGAVDNAATYDRKILVEDGIQGRELEVSVLGNDDPRASVPGEIVSHSSFYDYEEKYLKDSAELIVPAELPDDIAQHAADVAVRAFTAVDGSGLARVDMFLTPDGRLIVNEINTLPGFTSISMYPKLWEASGLPYDRLIDRLIDLAVERHQDKQLTAFDRKKV